MFVLSCHREGSQSAGNKWQQIYTHLRQFSNE